MIIKSYVISNGSTDCEIWTTMFKLYPDGLVINTGLSENFIIDYVDIPAFKKGLLEISKDAPEILVECSKDSDCILKLDGDDVHVILDDNEIIATFYFSEIDEIIEVLNLVDNHIQ
jgi:hypothetical protein